MFATGIFKILLVTAAGLPFGLPPQDEDPTLGRVAPEQCLLYVGWSGSSQPNASSSNEFEQLLAEPEIEMLLGWVEGRINQAVGEFSEGQETEGQESAKQTMKWAKSLITRPAALFLEEFEFAADGPKIGAGLIVNLGDDAGELQTLIGKLTKTLGDAATEVEIGGSAMYRLQLLPAIPPVTLGIKGKYFLAGIGQDTVGKMLQRGGTAAPAWLTDLRQRLKVERMSMIAYADVKSIIERVGPLAGPTTGELIGKLGLDNITSAARLRPLVIQSLFMRVNGVPPSAAELEAFCDRLNEITAAGGQIQLVQIYTIARRPAESFVTPLEDREVDAIVELVQKNTRLKATAFYGTAAY